MCGISGVTLLQPCPNLAVILGLPLTICIPELVWELAMGVRGRWGVTRDGKGELAFIVEWPWFWRYPAGALIAVAGVSMGLWLVDGGKSEWVGWLLAGGGALIALSVMYEAGCLAMVLAGLGGLWWAGESLFPNYETPPQLLSGICAAIAATAAFIAHDCLKETRAVRQELAQARQDARDMASVTNSLISQLRAQGNQLQDLDDDD